MSLWDIIIIISAVFLFFLAIIIFSFLRIKELKKQLTLIAGRFGANVSIAGGHFHPYTIQFERAEIVFNASIILGSKSSNFTVCFDLPEIREKFFIRHKSFMADINASLWGSQSTFLDCRPVTTSALSTDYLAYSLNPNFLLALLSSDKVVPEIVQYDSAWGRFVSIAFDAGHFEITNHTDGSEGAEKYRQVCETAIVFHDRIKYLTNPENQL